MKSLLKYGLMLAFSFLVCGFVLAGEPPIDATEYRACEDALHHCRSVKCPEYECDPCPGCEPVTVEPIEMEPGDRLVEVIHYTGGIPMAGPVEPRYPRDLSLLYGRNSNVEALQAGVTFNRIGSRWFKRVRPTVAVQYSVTDGQTVGVPCLDPSDPMWCDHFVPATLDTGKQRETLGLLGLTVGF